MRSEPRALTSETPYVLFVEFNPWSTPASKRVENHFFCRKKDSFWEYFQRYDIGHLHLSKGAIPIGPLDDEAVHELCNYDFAYYTLDHVSSETQISNEELYESRTALIKLIQRSRPSVVCFCSAKAYKHFFNQRLPIEHYGLLKKKISLEISKLYNTSHKSAYVFVMPSMLNCNLQNKDGIDEVWKELKIMVNVLANGIP